MPPEVTIVFSEFRETRDEKPWIVTIKHDGHNLEHRYFWTKEEAEDLKEKS